MSNLYSTDFNLWIDRTTRLLRERRWHEIDLTHLIEEVENLGKRVSLWRKVQTNALTAIVVDG